MGKIQKPWVVIYFHSNNAILLYNATLIGKLAANFPVKGKRCLGMDRLVYKTVCNCFYKMQIVGKMFLNIFKRTGLP